jgi:microcystin-dependent protein
MSEPYVGQVMIFAFNFAPRNWAFCNGALLPIAQYQALFSIIGTTYGGDGIRTFALPNIQDRTVMAQGQGPGLSSYELGQTSGVSDVTLQVQNLPAHSHTVSGESGKAATDFTLIPAQNDWIGNRSGGAASDFMFAASPGSGQNFSGQTISFSGSTFPHINEQPYLCMNYCIAVYGIFPSRN